MVCLLLIAWPSLAWNQATAANAFTKDDNGFRVHRLRSEYQASETSIRVLVPDEMQENKRYCVLFILPVVANADRKHGDGLLEIKKTGLHNKHGLICVAPEFTAPPWFADHDHDLTKRDESHLLKVVLPFVEKNYPMLTGSKGRLLVGFSKSGWGAFSLLLRHPQRFHRAAGWDPGIRVDTGPIEEEERQERIERLFGSQKNFENYRLSSVLRARGAYLGPEPRLFYYNTEGKRALGGATLHQLMVELEFPHHYVFELKRPHRWDSGWLPKAVEFLCSPSTTHADEAKQNLAKETEGPPVFHIADGLNGDAALLENYQRGLNYAINYFGNYGPYHIYLLGSQSEPSIRAIYRKRAESRADPNASESIENQITEFLKQSNIVEEIDAVLSGESQGGLTWSESPQRVYEDVTTNASGREKDPIENTWGALHEYHHVFQLAHCDPSQERTSDRHFCSWMAEGMATYSSAKFMGNLKLTDFNNYMLELRKSGANIGRPGINEFLSGGNSYRLDDETYWEEGGSAQVYYMLGAWATAYLIHVQGVDEVTVLKHWYGDILRIGKSAAFEKHMGLTLDEFYEKFEAFIRQSDDEVMRIFDRTP